MHAEIASRSEEIAGLCRSHGVVRLEVFGSAARGTDFDPATSDVDFLVEFDPSRDPGGFGHVFEFQNALAAALGREVDLLERLPRNEYLQASINQCREVVYDARGVESDPGCQPDLEAASAMGPYMKRDPRVYLEEAHRAAGEIMDYVEGIDLDGFLADLRLRRAVEWLLMTLGTALAGLEENSPELAERIPELTDAVRRGNSLAHDHRGIDPEEIWIVALPALPEQRRVVLSVLSELNREDAAPELRGHGP